MIMAEDSGIHSDLEKNQITGDIIAGEELKKSVASKNCLNTPEVRAYYPPEDPPFIFEPRPY